MRIAGRARTAVATVVVVAWVLLTASASAAPGDLDTTYGSGTGASRTNSPLEEVGTGVALEPDGKIVVVGSVFGIGSRAVAWRFLNPQGTLDPSFGGGSGMSLPSPTRIMSANAVVVQPDGAIVVAGSLSMNAHADMFVTRLSAADGSLDLGYGLGTGLSVADFGDDEFGNAVAFAPDGKIVVAGSGFVGQDSRLLAARLLNPEGTFDLSYGMGTGGSRPDFGGTQEGAAVAVQPDGRILVAGTSQPTAGAQDFVVARFLSPQGTEDPSFGLAGSSMASVDLGALDTVTGMVLQPDGKIVLAGFTQGNGVQDFAVARLNGDGTPDNSFGQGGKAIFDLGGADRVGAVALQSDGKIVLAGSRTVGTATDIAVVRLQPSGSPDTTFGKAGTAIVDLGQNEAVNGVVLQPDGKIVVAGTSTDGAGATSIFVARLLGDPASPGDGGTVTGPGTSPGTTPGTTPGGGTAVPTCAGRKATIIGTGGADTLTGTGGADVIVSLGGDDIVKGAGGDDIICTGDGNDHADGGAGADQILGGNGNDAIAGAAGADKLSGEAGNDKVSGGAGSDIISGGPGADTLAGQAGNDKISGGAGRDIISGGPGADRLAGQAGNDRISGGAGRDIVSGGAGKNSTSS